MAGRNVAFVNTIAGRCALSVNNADMPTPNGWVWAPLSDVARLESGHTPSRNHPEYWDGDIAWIGIKDARENHAGVIHDTSQHVTQAGIDNSAARVLPASTVCLSRTASVGYVVVMGRPMATSQDFVNWVCSPSLMPDYLKWVLLAEGEEGLRKFGKGTTHTTIYFPEVEAFHVALAPLNEQRRIVAKLETVFEQTRAVKARLGRIPALIEKLKRSVLAAAFRGDLTNDWRDTHPDVEPASAVLERIRAERRNGRDGALRAKGKNAKNASYDEATDVDIEGLPELPDTWCWATVRDIATFVTDGTHQPPETTPNGIPFIGIRNIVDGRIDWDSVDRWVSAETHRELTSRYRAAAGDTLYATVGATFGQAVLVRDNRDFVFQRHIAHVRAVPTINSSYLAACLGSPQCLAQARKTARGAAQPTVNLADLRALESES